MVHRISFLPVMALSPALFICLFNRCAFSAPEQLRVNLTSPLSNAKTIQVTETIWEAQPGPTPGSLQRAGVLTFYIERPNKFRVEWKTSKSANPTSYYISNGKTMISYDGKQLRSQPTAHAEWPFPLMGLLNNMPGPVSTIPAIRDGKQVLLAQHKSSSVSDEYWFDPKTHLLIRSTTFLTWRGKTTEVMRTEYQGWQLDKSLDPAVFHEK